jgi:hypothetical protein
MARHYEEETTRKLKGIILSFDDFKNLLAEMDSKLSIYKCVFDEDPYCGITIDGIRIEWNDEND